jgi:hypothetical protein
VGCLLVCCAMQSGSLPTLPEVLPASIVRAMSKSLLAVYLFICNKVAV